MLTQLPRVPSLIPSSLATRAIGREVSITIFTASSRNSGEKLFFGRGNYFTFPDIHPNGWTVRKPRGTPAVGGRGAGADRLRAAGPLAGSGDGEAADGAGVRDGAGLLAVYVRAAGAEDGPAGVDRMPCRGVRVLRRRPSAASPGKCGAPHFPGYVPGRVMCPHQRVPLIMTWVHGHCWRNPAT